MSDETFFLAFLPYNIQYNNSHIGHIKTHIYLLYLIIQYLFYSILFSSNLFIWFSI